MEYIRDFFSLRGGVPESELAQANDEEWITGEDGHETNTNEGSGTVTLE